MREADRSGNSIKGRTISVLGNGLQEPLNRSLEVEGKSDYS